MVKVTFTLDDETVRSLRRTSERLAKPQSQVVREAVRDYAMRAGRLSEVERVRMLKTFDKVMTGAPRRSSAEVDRELRDVRAARRAGGRRHDQ
jgi:predicted DNA-binding protein